MIPNDESYDEELDEDLEPDFELETEPSLTYAMNIKDTEKQENTFVGRIDGEDAVRQAMLKTFNTERFEYEIYSSVYGFERQDLIGKPIIYCMSELKDRITDALLVDDRIDSVKDLVVEQTGKRALFVGIKVVLAQSGEEIEMKGEIEV